MKINKITKRIKVTENNFKDFSKITTIPKDFEKSMVLCIKTWQNVSDDNQQENTMTTKPEWFNEFENKQEQRWKEQHEFNQKVVKFMSDQNNFNQRILSLVESLIKRVDNLVVKNNLKE